jgi:hypothetical protein
MKASDVSFREVIERSDGVKFRFLAQLDHSIDACRYRTHSNGLAVANEPSVGETTTKRTTLRHLWTMLGALGCV